MVCVPAEVEIDDKSILAQMERVIEAQRKLEDEMYKLRQMLQTTKVKEKRDSEESPKHASSRSVNRKGERCGEEKIN